MVGVVAFPLANIPAWLMFTICQRTILLLVAGESEPRLHPITNMPRNPWARSKAIYGCPLRPHILHRPASLRDILVVYLFGAYRIPLSAFDVGVCLTGIITVYHSFYFTRQGIV